MARKKVVKDTAPPAPEAEVDEAAEEPAREEEVADQGDAQVCVRGEGCSPEPSSCSPIDIKIKDGYVLRKLIDSVRLVANDGVFLMQEGMIRFQACGTGQGRYNEATPFVDTILFTDRIGHYSLRLPDNRGAIEIPVNMAEMQKATSGTRKPEPIRMMCRPDYSVLLLSSGGSDNPGVRLVSIKKEPSAAEPPEMGDGTRQPKMELDVAPFCAEVAEFLEKTITHVKIVVHDTYMDWIGYHDENTAVRTKRFGASARGDNASFELALLASEQSAEDVPGSTFFITKKTINALSKIKPIPADKSKIVVFHAPGYPLKLCFNISDIGSAHIYFIQGEK